MRTTALDAAIAEAERFLARANKLRALAKDSRDPVLKLAGQGHVDAGLYNWPKEQGAMRRASMDLTRAMADLRRRGD